MALQVKFASPALTFPGDGSIRVQFDDGTQMEFEDADSLHNTVLQTLPTIDDMRTIAIAQRMAVDPLLDSPNLWDGKTVTLDVEQSTAGLVFRVS